MVLRLVNERVKIQDVLACLRGVAGWVDRVQPQAVAVLIWVDTGNGNEDGECMDCVGDLQNNECYAGFPHQT